MISVRADVERVASVIRDLADKQLAFGISRALNDTAREAATGITRDLPRIFDRPTPFTRSAIATLSANKTSLAATVLVKDTQAKYLLHEEIGGTRTAAENTRRAGVALVLPGRAIKRDEYGNIPAGTLARIRQEITRKGRTVRRQAAQAAFKGSTISSTRDQGVAYFKGTGPKGGPGGYFRRMEGHKLVRLMGYESTTHYRPRLGFQAHVSRTTSQVFRHRMATRLVEAVRTAR